MGAVDALLLQAKLAWDGSEAEQGMGNASESAEKMQGRMGKTLKRVGTALAAAFTVDKIVNFGKECIAAGAEVSAETAAFNQIMGDYADEAGQKMGAIADATGMVDTRLTPYMTSMTAKFKGLGYGVDDATTMASRGLTMAADASAFWDMSLDDSMSHLNSFINGSYEGGEAIGLFANDTQMAAYAIEQGIVKDTKAWSALDEATKQATRLEYAENMMKQSGATGQAAKESGAYANVMANLTEKWRQFKATIGEPLIQNIVIPAVNLLTKGIDLLSKGVQYAKDHFDEWKAAAMDLVPYLEAAIAVYGAFKVGTAIQSIVTGFGNARLAVALFTQSQGAASIATGITTGALKLQEVAVGLLTGKITLSQVATALWTKAQAALNAVLHANPIGLVVMAIAALVAGFVLAYQKSETFRNFINGLWDSIKNFLQPALEAVGNFLSGTLGPAFQAVGDWINNTLVPAFKSWGEFITGTIGPALSDLGDAISGRLQPVFQAISDFITGTVVPVFQSIVAAVQEVLTAASPILEAIKALFSTAWENVKTAAETAWENIKVAIDTALQVIKGIIDALTAAINGDWSTAWEAIKGVVDTIWEGIKTSITNAIEAAQTIIGNTVAGIQSALDLAWEGIKGAATTAWEAIKGFMTGPIEAAKTALDTAWTTISTTASTAWEGLKTTASAAWEGVKSFITDPIGTAQSTLDTAWTTISTAASTAWTSLQTTASTAWETVKSNITGKIESAKSTLGTAWTTISTTASSAWNTLSTTAGTTWEAIKASITDKITNAQTTLDGIWSTISSAASTSWSTISSTASTTWETVKTSITGKIEEARDTVKGIIDAIVGFFTGAKFEWPKIPLPHFSISPSGWEIGDLLKGSIPSLGISWYAKAMDDAAILDGATIFGAAGGQLLGGGEAGREVVSGEEHLIGLINQAVARNNEAMLAVLREILEVIRGASEELYDTIVDALTDGVRFRLNEREFGRLVRAHA